MSKNQQTITRAHLIEAVRLRTGFSRSDSARFVEEILKQLITALTEGKTVKVKSFGSFHPRQQGLRTGRNPKTGIEAPIPPRVAILFRPSRKLRKYVNNPAIE